MNVKIDEFMNNIENQLSTVSAYPICGTLTGCTKILMGTIQTITALAVTILFFVPLLIGGELKHAFSHIGHGIGNIIAGVFESIPIVQSVLYGIRLLRDTQPSVDCVWISSYHGFKFMPYSSLVGRDWRFLGRPQDLDWAEKKIEEIIEQNGAKNLSRYQKFKWAKKLVTEHSGN